MGRRSQARKAEQAASQTVQVEEAVSEGASLFERYGVPTLEWVFDSPRWWRIVLVAIFALCVTLLFVPLVDQLYLQFLYDPATVIVPSLVSTAFGGVAYIAGWRLIIGTVGERPAPSPLAALYLVLLLAALVLTFVLLVVGWQIATAPTY